MVISKIKLYELLKAKIGDKEAEAFVEILDRKVDKKLEESTRFFATKDDIANAKVDIIRWVVGTGIALAGLTIAVVKFL